MSNNKQSSVEDLAYWKNNAEENYITTPISVLKYITELEKHIEIIKAQLPSDEEIKTYLNNHSYEFEHGFKDAIEFIKNKIQGGNK